jgi:hypothetical protein
VRTGDHSTDAGRLAQIKAMVMTVFFHVVSGRVRPNVKAPVIKKTPSILRKSG